MWLVLTVRGVAGHGRQRMSVRVGVRLGGAVPGMARQSRLGAAWPFGSRLGMATLLKRFRSGGRTPDRMVGETKTLKKEG